MLEAAGIAVVFGGLYAALALDVFYGDGSFVQTGRAGGELLHHNHLLHYAVIALGQVVARPFAADLFGELTIAMHLFTVAGLLIFHHTLVVAGCSRAQRLLGTAMVGGTGAVLFYATAIERQAPFFPFAALAFHALHSCGREPTLVRGALLGAAVGVATLVHATGHLLFVLAGAWLLAGCERHRGGTGAALRALVAAASVHAAISLTAASLVVGSGASSPIESQVHHILGFADLTWSHVTFNLVREWLLPFLPASVLFLLVPLVRRTRRLGIALLLAFVPYAAFSIVVLRDFDERGAYSLPLVLPLALALARLLPVPALAVATAVALAGGIALNREYAHSLPNQPSARQVDEIMAGGDAVVLFVGPWAIRPILRHRPGIASVDLQGLARSGRPHDELCAAFDAGHAAARAAGKRVLIATECLRDAERLARPPFDLRFFREHFLKAYRFTEHHAAGFEYALVEAKSADGR